MSSSAIPKSASLIWLTAGTKLATYDVVSKELTIIGTTGEEMFDIAMSPTGVLYGVDPNSYALYTIDRQTAKSTFVADITPTGGLINSLTFAQKGALYATQGSHLIKIHPTTGVITDLGDLGVGSAGDLTFYNDNLYLSAQNDVLLLVNVENPSQSTAISEIPTTFGLVTVYVSEGFSGAYHLYGASGTDKSIYEIDSHTGVISNKRNLGSFGSGDPGYYTGATSSQFTGL